MFIEAQWKFEKFYAVVYLDPDESSITDIETFDIDYTT